METIAAPGQGASWRRGIDLERGETSRLEDLLGAADSTLPLDQVSELSLDAQAWVLAAIEGAGSTSM